MTSDTHTRIAIVDDEEPARELLRSMLADSSELVVVGEAADGPSALAMINETNPHLVFLDIQLPGESGLEVAAKLLERSDPALIVFVTAYDRYAIRAFELNACDYLLKPFDSERLHNAIRRLGRRRPDSTSAAVAAVRDLLSNARASAGERVILKVDGRHVFLTPNEVEWIEAVGKEMHVHTSNGVIQVRETMGKLHDRLNPALFSRVHRSVIVNRNHVREIQSWFKGDFAIILRSGQRIISGKTHRAAVEALLDARRR